MRRTTIPAVTAATLAAITLPVAPALADAWTVNGTAPTAASVPWNVTRPATLAPRPESLPEASPTPTSPTPGNGYDKWFTRTVPHIDPRAAATGAILGASVVPERPAARVAGTKRVRHAHAVLRHVADPGRYWTVGPGDTLSAIGAVWGVSAERIAARNGIRNPDVIIVGQVIHRPGGAR